MGHFDRYGWVTLVRNRWVTFAVFCTQNEVDSSLANITALAMFNLCDENGYPDFQYSCPTVSPLVDNIIHEETLFEDVLHSAFTPEGIIFKKAPLFSGYIAIFDINGRRISQLQFDNNSTNVTFQNRLSPGIYFYTVVNSQSNNIVESRIMTIIW